MKILIDLDDTLIDLLTPWVNYLNQKHGTCVSPSDVTQWDIQQSFPTLTKQQVFEPLFDTILYDDIKTIPDAQRYLESLSKQHTIYIVTNTPMCISKYKLEKTLYNNFPYITPQHVIITPHKSNVEGDVLIDDYILNLVDGTYSKILFTRPHNMLINVSTVNKKIVRCDSWKQIYNQINKLHQEITHDKIVHHALS